MLNTALCFAAGAKSAWAASPALMKDGEGRACDPRLEALGLAAVLKPRRGRPQAPW